MAMAMAVEIFLGDLGARRGRGHEVRQGDPVRAVLRIRRARGDAVPRGSRERAACLPHPCSRGRGHAYTAAAAAGQGQAPPRKV